MIRVLCSGVQRAKTVVRRASSVSSVSVRVSRWSAVRTPATGTPRSRQARTAVPGSSPVRTLTVTPRAASPARASAAVGARASRRVTRPRKVRPLSWGRAPAGRVVAATARTRSPSAACVSARSRSRERSSSDRAQRSSTASTAPLVIWVCVPSRPGVRTTTVARRRAGSKGRAVTPSYDMRASSSAAASRASSRASGAGRSASWSDHQAAAAAQRSTSGSSWPSASSARWTTGRSWVRVPVLSTHRTSMAPMSCRAGSRRTMTPWVRARSAAPRARQVVTRTGSISGVSPTATATAKGSVSRPRPRKAALAMSTRGGVSRAKRIRIQETPWTERSKVVAGVFRYVGGRRRNGCRRRSR